MSDKVVFASQEVTLHKSQGTYDTAFGTKQHVVESVALAPGESVELDKLPDYQKEAVESGSVPGVEVMTKKEAEQKKAEVDKLRAFVDAQSGVNLFPTLSGPDADDGSHSDHEVPFEVKEENHRARGEEEAGSAEPKTRSGRQTRSVKGAEAEEGGSVSESDDK